MTPTVRGDRPDRVWWEAHGNLEESAEAGHKRLRTDLIKETIERKSDDNEIRLLYATKENVRLEFEKVEERYKWIVWSVRGLVAGVGVAVLAAIMKLILK